MDSKRKTIILTGFMGSGKSSVGKALSRALQTGFTDTDQRIEAKQGKTVSEIFETLGEAAFRQMETDCLKELLEEGREGILSTGGGLPLREENRRLLKQLGRVIYLEVTPQIVYERLKNDTARPLLQDENPKERIERLLSEREHVYREGADLTIEVSGKSIAEITEEIRERTAV